MLAEQRDRGYARLEKMAADKAQSSQTAGRTAERSGGAQCTFCRDAGQRLTWQAQRRQPVCLRGSRPCERQGQAPAKNALKKQDSSSCADGAPQKGRTEQISPSARLTRTAQESDGIQRHGMCTTLLRGLCRKWRRTHRLGSRGGRGRSPATSTSWLPSSSDSAFADDPDEQSEEEVEEDELKRAETVGGEP